MSTITNRKRRGGDPDNDLPKKVEVVPDPQYDVILVVEGQRFYCMREKLVESEFLKNMFSSDFKEKEAKEIELRMVKQHSFQLFLDFIDGVDSVTDENIEEAMAMVDYLQVPKLEIQCLEHLSQRSELSLRDQFTLAENSHSEKLVHQIMASIKDSFEFDKVVPSDLDSLSSNTKSIVLQKAFELLGHRKPAPPLLKPKEIFEHRVNEILDQVEIQNHHGQVLADQCELLWSHVLVERFTTLDGLDGVLFGEIDRDAEMKELIDRRNLAHDALERNYLEAQLQVAKLKKLYTAIDNAAHESDTFLHKDRYLTILTDFLMNFPRIINASNRNNAGAQELAVGNLRIDEIYRTIVARIENAQFVPNVEKNPRWLISIEKMNAAYRIRQLKNVPFPVGIRQISAENKFKTIDSFFKNIRNDYYGILKEEEQQNADQN